jgi:serine/threonine protein kinase
MTKTPITDPASASPTMGGHADSDRLDPSAWLNDLSQRWGRGERVRVEEYLDGHKGLDEDRELVLHLIHQEVLLRQEEGDRPRIEEYVERFPNLAEDLKVLLTISAILGGESLAQAVTLSKEPLSIADLTLPPPDPTPLPVIPGFQVLRELGRGGMGVVYQAVDLKRQATVALKTLPPMQNALGVDPSLLYRFKQEFRNLANVSHPNLVSLYEFHAVNPLWFFTMELVEGRNFLAHVRSEGYRVDLPTRNEPASPPAGPPGVPAARDSSGLAGLTPEQVDRLRGALRQLAEGVAALHEAGRLHRDIKPTNVLVTPPGRVVLLDFGLATQMDPSGRHQSTERHILGTAAYMAPEQSSAEPVSAASDWYSVGVMIYEALTGRLPFTGPLLKVLLDKQRFDPAPPRDLVADCPSDLNDLCMELLRRDPMARLSGREVIARLGTAGVSLPPARLAPPEARTVPWIGRTRDLAVLEEAFASVKQGRTVSVFVHGRSGIGKSSLIQHFLEGVAAREDAVVLAGRCYESESVPYKALDSLMDSLSQYLKHLSPMEAATLLPREAALLGRVFPSLRRVGAVAEAPARLRENADPQVLRERTVSALRELLARMSDRRPLVLFIDDLQWGDEAGSQLLADLMRPPEPPLLLLLGSYRSEEVGSSACLGVLRRSLEEAVDAGDRKELAIEELPLREAVALAHALLGSEGVPGQAEAVARESGGSPLFVQELVHHIQHGGTGYSPAAEGGQVTLEAVLWERIQRLPPAGQRLLEVVATAGQPLDQRIASQVAGLGADERTVLADLRSRRLLRGSGPAERDDIETYHDRIRETVTAHLEPATRTRHHLALAEALAATGQADPEVLAAHFHSGGALALAGQHYAQAADNASSALAFDHAALLYRRSLELNPLGSELDRPLLRKLADALASAGRGPEAARTYLSAAAGAALDEAIELRRRAAVQFLRFGHYDEGMTTLRSVLESVGMRLPTRRVHVVLSCLWQRLLLSLRGLGFRLKEPDQLTPEDRRYIDVCWSVGLGLAIVEPICAYDFRTRSLRRALRAGEASRIIMTLAVEAFSLADLGGPRRLRRSARILEATEPLAQRLVATHPHVLGWVLLEKGLAANSEGQWKSAQTFCDQAEVLFRERCIDVGFECGIARLYSLTSLIYQGELAEVGRRLPPLLQDARQRGDFYATMLLGSHAGILHLAEDRPQRAGEMLQELASFAERWPGQGVNLFRFHSLVVRTNVALYNGDGAAAWQMMAAEKTAVTRSIQFKVQNLRIHYEYRRGCCALAAAAVAADPRPLRRVADDAARRLERERLPWATALARLLQGSASAGRGDTAHARAQYAEAVAACTATHMQLGGAPARRRLGQLTGGAEGRALVEEADAFMANQMIRNPARFTDMIIPLSTRSAI